MNNLNSVLLEGNLTEDPIVGITPEGSSFCFFRISSNRFFKYDEKIQMETSHFDVEVYDKLAELCFAELKKDRGVRVVGRLHQEYSLDADGITESRVKIVGDHVEFKQVPKA